jgi:hypothetical protein
MGDCTAVGQYIATNNTDQAMTDSETNGVWGQSVELSSASTTFNALYSVACMSPGNCTAVGTYSPDNSGANAEAMSVTETAGIWGEPDEIASPSNTATNYHFGTLYGVSCPSPGYCTAVGTYFAASLTQVTMIATESNGTWGQAVEADPPPGTSYDVGLRSISCASVGDCTAVGDWASTESNGVWSSPTAFNVAPVSGRFAPSVLAYGVSCWSAGDCTAVGEYGGSSGGVPMTFTQTDGIWAQGTLVPSPSTGGSNPSEIASFFGVSCQASGACDAVGEYAGPGNQVQAMATQGLSVVPTPGYSEVAADGGIFAFNAGFYGSMGGKPLNQPIVGLAATSDRNGYWEVARDGGIFSFGDAGFYGSMGGKPLNSPVVGIAADPATGGYWEVAADGGIFSFNAGYYGSMGGVPLNQPIVGIAATADGGGYWEVARDGGIFSFGDAGFYGSMGGKTLNSPVVGIAADPATGGYWEVASDGGVFSFNAGFFGSTGGKPLNEPVVSLVASQDGDGYWEIASDGGVFNYGDANFSGSMGGIHLNSPVVGGIDG